MYGLPNPQHPGAESPGLPARSGTGDEKCGWVLTPRLWLTVAVFKLFSCGAWFRLRSGVTVYASQLASSLRRGFGSSFKLVTAAAHTTASAKRP
jgi:hypothetical protein